MNAAWNEGSWRSVKRRLMEGILVAAVAAATVSPATSMEGADRIHLTGPQKHRLLVFHRLTTMVQDEEVKDCFDLLEERAPELLADEELQELCCKAFLSLSQSHHLVSEDAIRESRRKLEAKGRSSWLSEGDLRLAIRLRRTQRACRRRPSSVPLKRD